MKVSQQDMEIANNSDYICESVDLAREEISPSCNLSPINCSQRLATGLRTYSHHQTSKSFNNQDISNSPIIQKWKVKGENELYETNTSFKKSSQESNSQICQNHQNSISFFSTPPRLEPDIIQNEEDKTFKGEGKPVEKKENIIQTIQAHSYLSNQIKRPSPIKNRSTGSIERENEEKKIREALAEAHSELCREKEQRREFEKKMILYEEKYFQQKEESKLLMKQKSQMEDEKELLIEGIKQKEKNLRQKELKIKFIHQQEYSLLYQENQNLKLRLDQMQKQLHDKQDLSKKKLGKGNYGAREHARVCVTVPSSHGWLSTQKIATLNDEKMNPQSECFHC